MKATMIVAALLSTVSALPAANGTEAPEVSSQVAPAEIQDLAAKTIASIKLAEEGNATPEQLASAVKDNLNQLENFVSSLNRGESSAMWPAFNDFAKGFNFEAGKAGLGGGKGGWGGHHGGQYWGKCTPRADDVDDMDNDLDGDCDDDDSLGGVVGLLLELVAETLDQIIPGLDDVVEELTDDLGTNDKNTKKIHNPDIYVKGKGPHGGKGGKSHGGPGPVGGKHP
jgi:hypothetical protein